MRAGAYDELADDDPLLLSDEPVRPIRLQYVTLTTERALLADTLERLGLAFVEVGRQVYALNECDTLRLRLTATEDLFEQGRPEPTEAQVAHRVAALLTNLVLDSAGSVERSTLRDPNFTAQLVGQQLRAEADAELAARGVALRTRAIDRISEIEAA